MSKKKIIVLSVLVVVLIAVSIVTVQVLNNLPTTDDKSKSNLIQVSQLNYASIQSIKITQDGSTIEVERSGDTWKAAGSAVKVDKITCESMATYLSYVYATNIVEEKPEGLDRYGLKTPSLTAELTIKNGQPVVFSFGRETADKTAVYFMKSGDSKVYTMLNDHYTQIKSKLDDMVDVTLPAIDAEHIATVSYKLGNLQQSVSQSAAFESGYVFDQSGAPASAAFMQQVQKTAGYRFTAFVGKDVKPEYGINGDFLQITDTAGKVLKLNLGAKDSKGRYYCTAEGKEGVFIMGSGITDLILSDVSLAMDTRLLPVNAQDIVSISLTGSGKQHTLKSENGQFTADGKTVTEAQYAAALKQYTDVMANGLVNDKTGDMAYTVTAGLKNGKQFTVKLWNYLKGFYALDYGKGPALYIKADALKFLS